MLLSMDEFRAFEPKKTTYALFGWPLGHTMSPELHAQLFEASGQDADYIGVAVPPEDLPEAFELAKRKLGGINCTIPHKKAVIPLRLILPPATCTRSTRSALRTARRPASTRISSALRSR